MIKCPMCGENTLKAIKPMDGYTGFFISAVNANVVPPSVDPLSGFPVQLTGCTSCGTMMLFNTNIINSSVSHE